MRTLLKALRALLWMFVIYVGGSFLFFLYMVSMMGGIFPGWK